MKFAFLVHPLGNETDRVLGYLREVDLQQSFARGVASLFHDLHGAMAQSRGQAAGAAAVPEHVRVIDEMPGLKSYLGARADGRIYEIPMNSFAILDDPDRALGFMQEAVGLAADWGAELVGLGAMTGIVGSQGTYLAERSPIPVTTGNSLTVYAAVTNLQHACSEVDLDLATQDVAVIGVPGSIAAAAARLLRPQCRSLLLVARQPSPRATALAAELDAELVYSVDSALARCRVLLSATSSGGCIDQQRLLAGSILSDVGVPTDTLGAQADRQDVLILSGGLCKVPETMPLTSHYLWFHRAAMAACVAETVVLALDGTAESLSLGRCLEPARIAAIGRRAEAHGFTFTTLFSFGQTLGDSALCAYRKALARPAPLAGPAPVRRLPAPDAAAPQAAQRLGARATERFRRCINPAMVAVGGGLLRTFVKGVGTRVWDERGKSYLDFLAGYGSLNLGHNHPDVVAAVQAALAGGAPGFSPAAINPFAAALAEQLAAIAPPGLEMVAFGNSGAEAVEATLKLARRATGREGLLYCERSYHGKTLGALSVTGNSRYQRPFGPLVPECTAIPYGDLEALDRALASHRFAAFLVEPLQAEGGMIVPPRGYLRQAETLCRNAGTLLAVDEVQTGLGRTGSMFAVDEERTEPDILALAKSLGGGLMPIGAMLTRRALWQKAYGSLDTFALHTSTFAGGSLACAAGLATLRVLRDGGILANAGERSRQLLGGLRALAARYPVIAEVRGQGLLVGVEFTPPPVPIGELWHNLLTGGAGAFAAPGLDDGIQALQATWVMALLLQEHGIYTQVARSAPRVLRIEPPLTVSAAEIGEFLAAMEQCCDEVTAASLTFEQMIAKSVRGQHGDEAPVISAGFIADIRGEPAAWGELRP